MMDPYSVEWPPCHTSHMSVTGILLSSTISHSQNSHAWPKQQHCVFSWQSKEQRGKQQLSSTHTASWLWPLQKGATPSRTIANMTSTLLFNAAPGGAGTHKILAPCSTTALTVCDPGFGKVDNNACQSCPAGTWSDGFAFNLACTACTGGKDTDGATGSSAASDCGKCCAVL